MTQVPNNEPVTVKVEATIDNPASVSQSATLELLVDGNRVGGKTVDVSPGTHTFSVVKDLSSPVDSFILPDTGTVIVELNTLGQRATCGSFEIVKPEEAPPPTKELLTPENIAIAGTVLGALGIGIAISRGE